MKNKCKVKTKIFGKKIYLSNFILWNTKHFGDRAYKIKETFLSDLLFFNDDSISSKINYKDEFFIFEDSINFSNFYEYENYFKNVDIESGYCSYLEISDGDLRRVYMIGMGKFFKLYDSKVGGLLKYKDCEDFFNAQSVIWTYDIEVDLVGLP